MNKILNIVLLICVATLFCSNVNAAHSVETTCAKPVAKFATLKKICTAAKSNFFTQLAQINYPFELPKEDERSCKKVDCITAVTSGKKSELITFWSENKINRLL